MVLVSTTTHGEGIDSAGEMPAVRLPAGGLLAGGLPAKQVCKEMHVKMSWEANFMLAMKMW